MRNASDGYAWGAMQLNISDLKGAMGEGSDYDDTALKRELEKQGKEIETNANAIEGKADEDHTHDNITDPYDDSWIQPEIDKKSDITHTHDITHDHDSEYQQKGDYADKNHIHDLNHNHDGEYLTSDDLPDPYDDTQIRDDFAAADQQLQDQITIINDAGYDDTAINQRISDEEQAREDGDAALSVKIDGKADDDHTHDPIDLEHNHNSQYQPIGDYATKTDLDSKSDTTHSHTPQDLTHDHNSEYQPLGNYADTNHDHPPQDLTHDHDMEYAPIHEHPYADTNHAHPPQDLTHDHDTEYQPVGDYATNQTVTDGDADLQEQIDAISSSGGYNDSWIQPAIDTGDANTLGGANAYTDAEIAKIVVPDVGDFATTDYVDAGDLAVEAKIPDVSGFATSEELTAGLASKSDTSHEHDEFTHTHDFSHDHDGEYALEHDHPYAPQAHDHPHDHEGDYQPTGDYALEEHEHLHDHDGTYQPAGNYSQIGHEHLHDHDGQYQPSGNYTNKEYVDASDANLQDQIDAIQSSGYDDTQLRADFAAGDVTTLASANAYTDEEVAKVFVPDVSDFATRTEVADGDSSTLTSANTYTDTEISKIPAPTPPYDDTAIKNLISDEETERSAGDQNLQDQIDTIQSSGYDDTQLRADFAAGDVTTLASANVYTDTEISKIPAPTPPYDDTQVKSDIQANKDSIEALGEKGYDDTGVKADIEANAVAIEENKAAIQEIDIPDVSDFATKTEVSDGDTATLTTANSYTDAEIAKIPDTDVSNLATKEELSTGLAGKADEPHTHDTSHNHNSEYQPLGDYATGGHTHDTSHTHDEFSDKDHTHPPQDLTHNHDAQYAPVHNHPYASDDHTHTPQDLTHNHEGEYQPVGDYPTKTEMTTADAAVEAKIPDVSGFATKTEVDKKLDKGSTTYLDAKAIEDDISGISSSIFDLSQNYDQLILDLGDAGSELQVELTGYLKKGTASYADAAGIEAEIDQEKTDRASADSSLQDMINSHSHDTSHTHTEYAETRHNHDGTYQPSGDYASGSHTHPPQDLTHDHAEYFLSGIEYDDDGNTLPLPYANANALGEAVDGKSETNHTHDLSHTHREYADKTEFELHQHEHNHDEEYVKKGHSHSNMQNEIDELKVHEHEGSYLPIGDWEGDQGFADDKEIFDFIESMFKVQELTDKTQNVKISAIEEREKNYADKSHNHEGVDEHEHDSVYLKKTGGVITGAIKTRGTLSNRHIGMQGTPPLKEDGSQDTTSSWGIKMDIDHANSYKSEFVVANRYGNIVRVTGGADPQAHIGPVERDGNNKPVPLKLSADPSEGDHAIRKSWADKNYLGNSGSQKHEGSLVIQKSSGVMLELKKNDTTTLEFWSDGSVEQPNLGANSKDANLVTRKNLKDANKPLEERIAVLEENQTGIVGIYLGEFELVYTGDRPTGATESNGNVRVWHKTVASSTTNPKNECKIGMYGDVGLVSAIDAFSGEARVILQQQGALQTWKFSGAWGTDSNKVLHISADGVSGDDLQSGGVLTKMWFLPV